MQTVRRNEHVTITNYPMDVWEEALPDVILPLSHLHVIAAMSSLPTPKSTAPENLNSLLKQHVSAQA
jgi:hypothetical protein